MNKKKKMLTLLAFLLTLILNKFILISMTEEINKHFEFIKRMLENKNRSFINDLNKLDVGIYSCMYYFVIYDCQEAEFSQLEKKLRVSSARMTKIIASLIEKKYVIKKTSDKDKRKSIIYLTKKGVKRKEKLLERVVEFSNRINEKVGREEIEKFIELFEKISNVAYEIRSELEEKTNDKIDN